MSPLTSRISISVLPLKMSTDTIVRTVGARGSPVLTDTVSLAVLPGSAADDHAMSAPLRDKTRIAVTASGHVVLLRAGQGPALARGVLPRSPSGAMKWVVALPEQRFLLLGNRCAGLYAVRVEDGEISVEELELGRDEPWDVQGRPVLTDDQLLLLRCRGSVSGRDRVEVVSAQSLRTVRSVEITGRVDAVALSPCRGCVTAFCVVCQERVWTGAFVTFSLQHEGHSHVHKLGWCASQPASSFHPTIDVYGEWHTGGASLCVATKDFQSFATTTEWCVCPIPVDHKRLSFYLPSRIADMDNEEQQCLAAFAAFCEEDGLCYIVLHVVCEHTSLLVRGLRKQLAPPPPNPAM